MASNAQGTAGILLKYCIETSAGTLPTTGYTAIGEITDIPAYDPSPVGLDCTPLSETVAHRYTPGLMDGGDTWDLEMNMTEAGITTWNSLATSAATAYASGKATWFACIVPGFSNAFYMAGIPAKIMWPGAGVDEVFQGTAHITITDASKGWAAKPTT